ncbi:papain fold toxin domain-containing protein [Nostoc sp.]
MVVIKVLPLYSRRAIIFDNHHRDGLTREEWLANLLFYNKLYYGQQFEITEENF